MGPVLLGFCCFLGALSAPILELGCGFPALYDQAGQKLADSQVTRALENGRLTLTVRHDFGAQHTVEEVATFNPGPPLTQETWHWIERYSGRAQREFNVDLRTAQVSARYWDGDQFQSYSKQIKVEPNTFVGSGFILAIESLQDRLLHGETIRLRTVGFTPRPHTGSVEVSYLRREQITLDGDQICAEHFVIHPRIPSIVKPFLDSVPDANLWLSCQAGSFVRSEGLLVQPGDQIVRVDLHPDTVTQ